MRAKDHQVLITGAAGGLGSSLAMLFAEQGANLLLTDKDARGLEKVSDRICGAGHSEPGICVLDLAGAGPDEVEQLVGLLEREYGGLKHLVHCAAHFEGLRPMDQLPPEQWLETIQVNLHAPWLLTNGCLPLLRRAGNASLTFVLDSEEPCSKAYWGAYGVSKAAVRSMARIIREELHGSGIRVHAIDPGPMRTALRAKAFLAEPPGEVAPAGEAGDMIFRKIFLEPEA